jgi:hypothetical protein
MTMALIGPASLAARHFLSMPPIPASDVVFAPPVVSMSDTPPQLSCQRRYGVHLLGEAFHCLR